MGEPGSAARYQKAQIYLEQGRYPEAADAFKLVLADDPENVSALVALAACLYQQEGKEHEKGALEVADRALAIDPELQGAHALKAMILGSLKRFPEAHQAAAAAISLDPGVAKGYGAEAQVWVFEQKWSKAAEVARRGLEQDPEDGQCSALLAHALLMLGDAEGHREEIAYRMSRDPENPYTHSNMGYAALRNGDHRAAAKHFAEALRLEPSSEPARAGMIEAFRARSPLYRAYLAYAFWMSRMPPRTRMFTMIGLYVAYRIAHSYAKDAAPRVAVVLVVLWLSFVLFTFLSRGVGTLIVLGDRFGRMALTRGEKSEGMIVGGGAVAGLVLVLTGVAIDSDSLTWMGACLVAPTVPLSVAFGADEKAGKWLYGTLGVIVSVCAAVVFTGLLAGASLESLGAFVLLGSLLAAGSTFLACFGVKTD